MFQQPSLHNFHFLTNQQWSILNKNKEIFLINNYTLDQFILYQLQIDKYAIKDQYSKIPSPYTVPNTPQILLPTVNVAGSKLEYFIQIAPYTLDKFFKKNPCLSQIHSFLKIIVKTIQVLIKKYGFFKLTYQMIKITKNNNLIIWINQNYTNNYKQYPLNSPNIYQNYKEIIKEILYIFEKAGCTQHFNHVKKYIYQEKFITFDKFLLSLQSQLYCTHKIKNQSQKFYKIPEFLKKNTSPSPNITPQQLTISPQSQPLIQTPQTIKTTPIKSLTKNLTNTQYFSKNLQNQQQLNSNYNIKTTSPLIKTTLLPSSKKTNQYKFGSNKTNSQNSLKPPQDKSYQPSQQQTSQQKTKKIRQTSNTLATTNGQLHSIASSGKFKSFNCQDHHSSTLSQLNPENKKLISSSAGLNQLTKHSHIKQLIHIKISKIIQQNTQQLSPSSNYLKPQNPSHHLRQSQIYRDLDGLLKSSIQSDFKLSDDLIQLENQFNQILFG